MKFNRISISVAVITVLAFLALSGDAQAQNRQRCGARENSSDDQALKVGQLAPTFKLKSLDGKTEFDLKSVRGDKPVLLFFGSYT